MPLMVFCLFFFYFLLHSPNGALVEEGHQVFGTVVVEEFQGADVLFLGFACNDEDGMSCLKKNFVGQKASHMSVAVSEGVMVYEFPSMPRLCAEKSISLYC